MKVRFSIRKLVSYRDVVGEKVGLFLFVLF
jgi:hypothetical protein